MKHILHQLAKEQLISENPTRARKEAQVSTDAEILVASRKSSDSYPGIPNGDSFAPNSPTSEYIGQVDMQSSQFNHVRELLQEEDELARLKRELASAQSKLVMMGQELEQTRSQGLVSEPPSNVRRLLPGMSGMY
jgi:hypothetical protein